MGCMFGEMDRSLEMNKPSEIEDRLDWTGLDSPYSIGLEIRKKQEAPQLITCKKMCYV